MSSEPIYLELDKLPPSVNSLWRGVNGRVLVSRPYRNWKAEAGWKIKAQIGQKRIAGPYALQINAVRPDARRRDLANFEKALSDLLVSLNVIDDDSECQELHMSWVAQGPPLWVALRPCTRKAEIKVREAL